MVKTPPSFEFLGEMRQLAGDTLFPFMGEQQKIALQTGLSMDILSCFCKEEHDFII